MGSNNELTSQGRQTRTEYLRAWRRKHPDKCREYSDRYWSKRGSKQAEQKQEKGSVTNEFNA